MYYVKSVNVECRDDQLDHEMLDSLFWEHKITFLNVIKHVFAIHVFNYYEVVVAVLENIKKFDYIRVLAHLQHFDLSPLLNHLYWLHVCFFY